MNYRLVKVEDLEQIKELCESHNIRVPYNSNVVFVAEDGDKIVGVVGLKYMPMIEPIISDNSVVAVTLFHMIEAALALQGAQSAICLVKDEKNIKTFQHAGFDITDESMTVMEKYYNRSK